MSLPPPTVRRIVTAHNEAGIAVVKSDEAFKVQAVDGFPGVSVGKIWVTNSVPTTDNNDEAEGAFRPITGDLGIAQKGATACMVTAIEPGAKAFFHRTASLDHNILISGKLILMMEDGTEVLLEEPGSIVIQRGTMHGWRNPGPDWVHWVCVTVDADPAVIQGKPLPLEVRPE